MEVEEINFDELDANHFEQLCFDLIDSLGYEKLKWRRGKLGQKAEIEAFLSVPNKLIGSISERWFFICEHDQSGTNQSRLDAKITSIKNEPIDCLVFITSSYLTKDTSDWIEQYKKQLSFKFYVIEGIQLKSLLSNRDTLFQSHKRLEELQELIHTIKKQWILFDIIPSFDALLATFELDRNQYKTTDLALVLCFLLYEEHVANHRFDQFYPLIEEAISILFEDVKEFGDQSFLSNRNIENNDASFKTISNIDKPSLNNEDEYFSEHLIDTLFINHEIEIRENDSLTDAYYLLLIRPIECIEVLIYKGVDCTILIKKMEREKCAAEFKQVFEKLGRSDVELIF